MTSNDELLSLYLCDTDYPILIEKGIKTQLNNANLINILENHAEVEETFENPESMLNKRLVLNPFLDEDLRCEILEKMIDSNDSEKLLSEICQESYFTNNLVSNSKAVVRITGTILDWKQSKYESIRRLTEKFIEKYITEPKIDLDITDKVKNKISCGQ